MHFRAPLALLLGFGLALGPARAQAPASSPAPAPAPAEAPKAALPRLAILDFKASGECWKGWRDGGWGPQMGTMSGQLRDLLTTELMAQGAGKLRMVERAQLEELQKELALQQSGEVDVRTVRRLGKLLGVSHVLVGKVTRFAYQATRAHSDLTGAGVKEVSFTGRLDLRLLDVETGEVLEVFREEGTLASTQVTFLGAGLEFAYDGELVGRVFEPITARLAPKIVAATVAAKEEGAGA